MQRSWKDGCRENASWSMSEKVEEHIDEAMLIYYTLDKAEKLWYTSLI
jgi:hypothetical protein